MRVLYYILIIQLFAIVVAFGQSEFKCGTDEVLKGNPELQKILENIEKDYQQKKRNQINVTPDMTTVYTIPVVFHVYHLGEAVGSGSNVSDAAIQASVSRLNAVFRATGIHSGLTPDIKIQFVLASFDPNCQSTNGIVRVDGRSISGYINGVSIADNAMHQAMRNLSTWDINQYVNIRICHNITDTGGFAYFLGDLFMPAGSVNINTNHPDLDNFWAHEMGHSLNLYHTFHGDGTINGGGTGTISVCPVNNDPENDGDKVSDTDPHKNDDGCNHTAINSCTGNPFGDILKNIMSYSCKEKFTPKQMERMRYALINYRSSLITSKGITGIINPPIANSNTRCSPGSVTLTASGCSGTYNWYASSSGGSSLGAGSTFNTPSISSTATYYVSCTEGNCLSIRTPTQAIITNTLSISCYCNSVANASYSDFMDITNVSVGSLTNSSTCSTTGTAGSVINKYSDFTNLSPVNYTKESQYPITIQSTNCNGSQGGYIVKVFIDFNQNGNLNDEGEVFFIPGLISEANPNAYGSIVIPNSALIGNTFMRIVLGQEWDINSNGSCGNIYWGETEDYKINIVDCTPPLAPTTISANRCGTGTVTLSASGCSGTYNWYAAISGGASLASTVSYTTPSISSTTNYYVSCTVGSCISTRTIATATIKVIPTAPTLSASPASISTGQSSTLSASNCAGTVTWSNNLGTGTSKTVSPAATTTYTATCTVNGCTSVNGSVTVTLSTCNVSAPTTTSANRCGSGTVTLSASGCSGLYNWFAASSGGTSLASTASYITPSINSTTNYYVACTVGSCISTRTIAIATIKTIPTAPTLSASPASISIGQSSTLSASNCAGTVTWSNSLGTGTSKTVSPAATITYTATCSVNGCTSIISSTNVSITVQSITFTNPTSGTYSSGQSVPITYTSSNGTGSVNLELVSCTGTTSLGAIRTSTTASGSLSYAIPTSLVDGSYRIKAYTSSSPANAYYSTCFNYYACGTLPDIIISDVSITKYAANRVNYAVTIKNTSISPASLGSVTLGVFASPDALRNNNDIFKSAISVGGETLLPDQTLVINDYASFNFGDPNYYLGFSIDYHSLLTECYESNNDFVKLINKCNAAGTDIVLNSLPDPFYAFNGTVTVPSTNQYNTPKFIVARAFKVNPTTNLTNLSLVVGNCLTVPAGERVSYQSAENQTVSNLGTLEPGSTGYKFYNLSKNLTKITLWDAFSNQLIKEYKSNENWSLDKNNLKRGKYIVRLESEKLIEAYVVEI